VWVGGGSDLLQVLRPRDVEQVAMALRQAGMNYNEIVEESKRRGIRNRDGRPVTEGVIGGRLRGHGWNWKTEWTQVLLRVRSLMLERSTGKARVRPRSTASTSTPTSGSPQQSLSRSAPAPHSPRTASASAPTGAFSSNSRPSGAMARLTSLRAHRILGEAGSPHSPARGDLAPVSRRPRPACALALSSATAARPLTATPSRPAPALPSPRAPGPGQR
jgi:hypothetical protein